MRVFVLLIVIIVLGGCAGVPEGAFRLSETALETRSMQSRRYDTLDRQLLLQASMGVLQDMGYVVEESSVRLGVLTASKKADAKRGGQVAAAVVIALLGGGVTPIDKEQQIKLTIVVNDSLDNEGSTVARMTMQRVIWNTQNEVTKAESISNPVVYQDFFQKLSKSTFLEAFTL